MHELLPETWMEEEQSEVAVLWGFLFLKKTKTSVTDILCWVQAYAILVSVLMAYLSIIIWCYRNFESMHYDRPLRKQAALVKECDWSQIQPTIYNLCLLESKAPDLL